jgi:hypothetical protein
VTGILEQRADCPALSLIRNIGCISIGFGDEADPLSTIAGALAGREDLSDALIVLPEALDLGSNYCSDESVPVFKIAKLEKLSRDYKVAFVVGLSDFKSTVPRTGRKPHNSAFLIDPEGMPRQRLSRKMCPDGKAKWYEGFTGGDSKCINYRGLTVASLICEDATEFRSAAEENERQRLHQQILTCLKNGGNNCPVLCVPARMGKYYPETTANSWPSDINIVIANVGNPASRGSGVRLANGKWSPCKQGLCLNPVAPLATA